MTVCSLPTRPLIPPLRLINQHVAGKVFKFVPKNRIVTNTFKVRNN